MRAAAFRRLAARLYQDAAGEDRIKAMEENELMNVNRPGMAGPHKNGDKKPAPCLVIYGSPASWPAFPFGREIPDFFEGFPTSLNERVESAVPSRPAPARQIGGVRP